MGNSSTEKKGGANWNMETASATWCTSTGLPVGSAHARGPPVHAAPCTRPLQLQHGTGKHLEEEAFCSGAPEAVGETRGRVDREAIRSLIPHIHGCDRMHPCVAAIAQTSPGGGRGGGGGFSHSRSRALLQPGSLELSGKDVAAKSGLGGMKSSYG